MLPSRALFSGYRVDCYSTQALGRALRRTTPPLPARSSLADSLAYQVPRHVCTLVCMCKGRPAPSFHHLTLRVEMPVPSCGISLSFCLTPSLPVSPPSPLSSRLFLSLGSTLSPLFPRPESSIRPAACCCCCCCCRRRHRRRFRETLGSNSDRQSELDRRSEWIVQRGHFPPPSAVGHRDTLG